MDLKWKLCSRFEIFHKNIDYPSKSKYFKSLHHRHIFMITVSKLSKMLTLRAEMLAIINCRVINDCGTYFWDLGPKSQKFDPQNTI